MSSRVRTPRTALVIGRPAHVPTPVVLDDPAKIRRLLAKALNERECALRVKTGSVILSLRVLDATFRGGAIRLEWQSAFSRSSAATLASPPVGTPCTWLVLAGGRGAIGFRSTVLEAGRGWARIADPAKIVYVQKREELRYRIPGGYEFFATFPGLPPARIFDLSAGGISVVLPAAGHAVPAAKKVTFRLHGQSITARVEVIPGKTEARNRPTRRLRFKFISLPDPEQDLIRLFVVDHLVSLDIDSEV